MNDQAGQGGRRALPASPHVLKSGTPGRIRTFDQKIKSLLLYQLSYGGNFKGAKNNKVEEMRKLLFDGNAEGDTMVARQPRYLVV